MHVQTVAITTDISFRGKQTWFNNEKTILDLGGCENLINSDFVRNHLCLPIQTDSSLAALDVQKTVDGSDLRFDSFVDIQCNFKGHRDKIRFFLLDDLPLPFLLDYPFFQNKGAVFDLDSDIPSVTLHKTDSKPTLRLTSSADKTSSFIFPISSDMPTAIHSAFITTKTTPEIPDREKMYQDFCAIFLQEHIDDILIESTYINNLTEHNPSSKTPTNSSDTGGEIASTFYIDTSPILVRPKPKNHLTTTKRNSEAKAVNVSL